MRDLDGLARATGLLGQWHRLVRPAVGDAAGESVTLCVTGGATTADRAIDELLGDGRVIRAWDGVFSKLELTETGVTDGRRLLFELRAEEAVLLYDAGRRLAMRLSTSSKKWASAESSSTTRSSTPARRLEVAPGV